MSFFDLIRMNRSIVRPATRPTRGRTAGLALALVFVAVRVAADANSADPKRYLDDVKALSSPVMEGRGAGTKGIERAANMIEQRYLALGLQPAGAKSFFQPFTVITGAKLKAGNRLEVEDGKSKQSLKLNQDFVPFSFSASGDADGAVVFAGYGATAPEFGYDDYAHLDVKDKIVVLLRFEPAARSQAGDGHETAAVGDVEGNNAKARHTVQPTHNESPIRSVTSTTGRRG